MRAGRTRGAVIAGLACLSLAACSPAPTSTGTHPGPLAVAGCPEDIRVAAPGISPAELGHLFELLGDDTVVVPGSSASGTLVSEEVETGATLTILLSGEGLPGAHLHSERSTFLAVVDAEDAVAQVDSTPTVAVYAPFDSASGGAYPGMISLLATNIEPYVDCLGELVPMLQRAHAAYRAAPERADALVLQSDVGLLPGDLADVRARLVPGDGDAPLLTELLAHAAPRDADRLTADALFVDDFLDATLAP